MLIRQNFFRFFHTSSVRFSVNTNKSNLATLRKNTGYTFANCKKALEVNNNNVIEAEKWLKEQAQALGWAKATKLANRETLQGLVAVMTDKKYAAMVEINCETDFVSKNNLFHDIAATVASTCFSVVKSQIPSPNEIAKKTEMDNLLAPSGKSLADEIALLISKVGENISLRRAICISVPDNFSVTGYTHPNPFGSTPPTGKYGCLLVYEALSDNEETGELAKQLCQHVIGMKPQKIGDINTDTPKENKDDEVCMIFQQFLMEPETSMTELLDWADIKLTEFVRYEVGEEYNLSEDVEVDERKTTVETTA